jgi:hypothetical protein
VKRTLDFIVVGAQKAGTTTLFEYLGRHPSIALPAGKEVPYFSHDARYRSDWHRYLQKTFTFADPGNKWGTVTPHYMVGGVYERARTSYGSYDERAVPLRIRDRLPDVRLIAILRDPVERAFSHYRMVVMWGREHRSFDVAIDQLLGAEALEDSRRLPDEATGYVAWGEYGRILSGYLDVFPREQILVVFTKELEDAPGLLLRRIHGFIGVDHRPLPDNLAARYRVSGVGRRLSWLDVHRVQRAAARTALTRAVWHAVPEKGQRHVDYVFNRTAYRVDLWNRRPDGRAHVLPSPLTLTRLREHFASDTARLTEVLGVSPPWETAV